MNFFLNDNDFMFIFSSHIVQEFRHLEQFMRFVLNGSCKNFTVYKSICGYMYSKLTAFECIVLFSSRFSNGF